MQERRRTIAGRYLLGGSLGVGGHARVWRCTDLRLRVDRAIKLIEADNSSASARERLKAEAEAMAALRNPHILQVFDVGTENDVHFVVMDLAEGGSIADRLADKGRIPPRQAAEWTRQLLEALDAAHAHRIVHRDVKPQNVLLDHDGTAKLADFGIALVDWNADRQTRTGSALGSFAFMAPEQRIDARSVGPTADIYAAGATLYNLVTASTPVDLFAAPPTSPRWSGIPSELAAIIRRATALEPEHRYPSAQAMRAAIEEVLPVLSDRPLHLTAVAVERMFPFASTMASPTPVMPYRSGPITHRETLLGDLPPLPSLPTTPPAPAPPTETPPPAWQWGLAGVAVVAAALLTLWWVAPGAPPPAAAPSVASDAPEAAVEPVTDEVVEAPAAPAPAAPAPPPSAPPPVVAPAAARVAAPPPAAAADPCGEAPPGDLSEALRGAWSGSMGALKTTLVLGGNNRAIEGVVCVGGRRARPRPLTGTLDARGVVLDLIEVEDPNDPGATLRYRLSVQPGRLDGTAERVDGKTKQPAFFRRPP